jgi:hypothetical protein
LEWKVLYKDNYKRLLRLCVDEAQNTIYAIAINEEIISISVPEIDRNGAEKFEAGDFQIKGKTGKDDVCILLNDA